MRFPAFMFWPERYWLDTYDLSDSEHGIYLRLLLIQWNTPECKIPNDDAWIGAKMQRSVQAIEEQVKPIIHRFFKTNGNWIYQAKLLSEYERLSRLSKRGSDANKSRWKQKNIASQTAPSEKTVGSISESEPTPTPTPTLLELPPINPPKRRERRETEDTTEFLTFWEAYPHKVGKPVARQKFAIALRKADLPTILAGLERYKRAKPDYAEWRHPATWLNQEGWLDKPAPRNGANGANGHDRRAATNPRSYSFSGPVPEHRTPKEPPPPVSRGPIRDDA